MCLMFNEVDDNLRDLILIRVIRYSMQDLLVLVHVPDLFSVGRQSNEVGNC